MKYQLSKRQGEFKQTISLAKLVRDIPAKEGVETE